ncbi:phage small terminase subunit [Escherichia coli UMEA 3318-1]|nr:phage small terminase subunit [Escherichia coli UMEA 3318-1]EQY91144.1 phage small terminase subunit [Escherichia coli UMEA 3318-1]
MAGTAGRSGRRPKPTARKALAGNPGKRALNKDEPVFTPIKGVEPPEWFAEEDLPLATIMWQLTTKELCGQGLLCVTDLAVLERWCVAYEFWRRAVKNIARQGNTITGAMGGMVKNPELTAKKEQESEMSSTGAMLGLDPSSRQRLIGLAGQKKATKPRRRISSARVRTVLPVVTPRLAHLPPIWMMTTLICCRKNSAAWWRHPVPAWRRGETTSCLPRFVLCC